MTLANRTYRTKSLTRERGRKRYQTLRQESRTRLPTVSRSLSSCNEATITNTQLPNNTQLPKPQPKSLSSRFSHYPGPLYLSPSSCPSLPLQSPPRCPPPVLPFPPSPSVPLPLPVPVKAGSSNKLSRHCFVTRASVRLSL